MIKSDQKNKVELSRRKLTLSSNIRQGKYRTTKRIKTLKIPDDLLYDIGYEAKIEDKTIETFLRDIVKEMKLKRVLEEESVKE